MTFGSKAKGSAAERRVCVELSEWLSNGTQKKLFNRNVLSGGRFSRAVQKGDTETGIPGDIAAAHPLAYELLTLVSVEVKHYKSIDLEGYVYGASKCLINRALQQAEKDAGPAGTFPLTIIAGNRRDPLLFIPRALGERVARDSRVKIAYHTFHRDLVYAYLWREFIAEIPAKRFMELVRSLKT